MTELTEEKFLGDVKDHQIYILKDDGVYRHLVFMNANGSSCQKFELVTFPGCLVYTGNMGCYTFRRELDMFHLFNKKKINPSYWGEKCTSEDSYSGMVEYSKEVFGNEVEKWIKDWAHDQRAEGVEEEVISSELERIEDEILAEGPTNEYEARDLIYAYTPTENFPGTCPINFDDFWEIKLTEATHRYLWACHAIRWGVEQYFNLKG